MEQKVTEVGVFEYTESVHGGYWETKKTLNFFQRTMKSILKWMCLMMVLKALLMRW